MSYNMSTGLWGRADEDIRFPSAVQTSLQITAKEYIADISSDTKLQETSVEGFADDLKISFNGPLCHEAFLVSSEVLSGDEVLNLFCGLKNVDEMFSCLIFHRFLFSFFRLFL
jgi:hypothetical protein